MTGLSKSALSDALCPHMDLNSVNVTSQADGILTIQLTIMALPGAGRGLHDDARRHDERPGGRRRATAMLRMSSLERASHSRVLADLGPCLFRNRLYASAQCSHPALLADGNRPGHPSRRRSGFQFHQKAEVRARGRQHCDLVIAVGGGSGGGGPVDCAAGACDESFVSTVGQILHSSFPFAALCAK